LRCRELDDFAANGRVIRCAKHNRGDISCDASERGAVEVREQDDGNFVIGKSNEV
jgi:hypothetical protein